MNVVLYLRYSSDAQTEQSIEGQRRVCEEYCRRMDYTIVGEYADRATSASHDTEKRLQYLAMIRDSAARRFEGVVVYKLDRFARNRYDSAIYKARLARNGVRLISATEAISDSPEGIILESVLEGMAEYYSKELSQKVRRGMKETALKGKSCGGRVPLGYALQDGRFVEDPVTAPIIRELFDRYVSGERLSDIGADFNARGYRTSTGRQFNANSWNSILTNRRYLGIYIYDGIEQTGGMPRIIDDDTFQRAQERVERTAHKPGHGKAAEPYELAEKAFCGLCGASLVGESGRGMNGTVYRYYTCADRKRGHKCGLRPIPKDWLERAVAEDARSLLTPRMIDRLADMAVKASQDDRDADTRLPLLRQQLDDVEKRIANLLKLVERGADSDSLLARLDALEAEKRAAQDRLADAEADTVVLQKPHVIFFLEQFSHGDIEDDDFRRLLLSMLVKRVTVWPDDDPTDDDHGRSLKIEIAYNLTNAETHTFRASDISDLIGNGSPNPTYPNYHLAEAGRILLHTIKRRVG